MKAESIIPINPSTPLVAAVTEVWERNELADYLKIAVEKLDSWRAEGRGPAWKKRGDRIVYSKAAVEAWLDGEVPAVTKVGGALGLLTPDELMQAFGMSRDAWYKFRKRYGGPKETRLGGEIIRFRIRDIEAYLDACAYDPNRKF